MSTYILKMSSFSLLLVPRFLPFSLQAFRLFKQSHSPPHKYNFVNFAGE